MEVQATDSSVVTSSGFGFGNSSGIIEEWHNQSAHATMVAYAVAPDVHSNTGSHQTHCLPVDLCTSALRLTVTHPSVSLFICVVI